MPRQNPKRSGSSSKPASKSSAKLPAEPKKSTSVRRPWDSKAEYAKGAASFFASQMSDAEAKNGGVLVGNEAERVCIGLPLKAFSLQYVHSSDVYPLGRMGMTIGESDSCKTAYLFEQMRWFLREKDAGAVYLLNEARDPADLRTSIIGKELLSDGRFQLRGPHDSLEHWQRNQTAILHQFENTFKVRGGCAFPVICGLDSITGTTNEETIKDIDELGHAKVAFAKDANLLNIYAKYLFQRVYRWPMAFVCTNHIKYGQDRYGNKIMRIPGGDELRYVSTYITLFTKKKDISRLDVAGGRELRMKMVKSMGDHREIDVEFTWTFDSHGQQHSVWDWHSATVTLLAGFTGERKKALEQIITFPNYNKSTRTTSCPEAGIKKPAPFDEVGAAIMATPSLLRDLQNHFGIKRRRVFEHGVPYIEQIQKAIEAGDVEQHDSRDVSEVDKSSDDDAPAAPTEIAVEE